jgi:triacylglycerol lipase
MNTSKLVAAFILLVSLTFSTQIFAAAHSSYVAPKNCSWWDLVCQYKQNDNRYNTQYPIVLVHGVSGFDQVLFLVEYFHDIPASLGDGNARVYTPNISAWHDAYYRGEQLHDYIVNHVLPHSGASKVNLIGHSLGGPTARYVASVNPGIVASVTTVNAVNYGSGFADWGMTNFPQGSAGNAAITSLLNALGAVTDFLAGDSYDQDALASVLFMTSAGATTFNNLHPQGQPTSYCGTGANLVNGIRYYSWGSTGGITNAADPLDYAMWLMGSLGFSNNDQDGLVARCSMHWGEVLRDDYTLNHTDATNLLFGMAGWTDPRDIYKNHASRLRGLGL